MNAEPEVIDGDFAEVDAEARTMLPAQWPGVFDNIPNEVYHMLPGISRSGLEAMHRSPAHFYALFKHPLRPAAPARSGQIEGTLAHCAILEPAAFHDRFIVPPKEAPRRPSITQWQAKKPSPETIDAIAYWSEFELANKGKRVITPAQYETAWRQHDAVHALDEVAEVLDAGTGQSEPSAFWVDSATGELCRCRPDRVSRYGTQRAVLLDVKTCADASDDAFARMVGLKRYHVQDAFYTDGFAAAAGVDVMGFVFIAVESEYPFAANALMLDEKSRRQGRDEYRTDLTTYAHCMRSNVWPGFGGNVKMIALPRWARAIESESTWRG